MSAVFVQSANKSFFFYSTKPMCVLPIYVADSPPKWRRESLLVVYPQIPECNPELRTYRFHQGPEQPLAGLTPD